jgi:hypothetical protein
MNAMNTGTMWNPRRMRTACLVAALAAASAACNAGSDLSPTAPSASTPAVSGTWTGKLTQPGGPIGETFSYSAVLVQSGTTVSGTATIERQVDGQRYYAQQTVVGSVNGMGVDLRETGIVSHLSFPGVSWCSKSVVLTLSPSRRQMSGDWAAPGCLPGLVELSK